MDRVRESIRLAVAFRSAKYFVQESSGTRTWRQAVCAPGGRGVGWPQQRCRQESWRPPEQPRASIGSQA